MNGSIYGGPAEVLERPVSQGTSSGNIFLLVLPTPALLVFHEEEEEEEEEEYISVKVLPTSLDWS